jgi:hypothetical protein
MALITIATATAILPFVPPCVAGLLAKLVVERSGEVRVLGHELTLHIQ